MKTNPIYRSVETQQIIETIKFNEIFSLYKLTTKIGEHTLYNTGICLNDEVSFFKKTPETFSSENAKGYMIFTKETPEICRTDFHKFQINFNNYYISVSDLMDRLNELEDFSDYIILKFDSYTDTLYEYGSTTPILKSMYFDYINGCFDNEYYNLEECLKVLEKRTDVIINPDKFGNRIIDVPYYNQNEDENRKYIDFCWQPTTEDWLKISNKLSDYHRCEIILSEIFNFNKIC